MTSPNPTPQDFRERLAQSFADDLEEMAQKAADAEGVPMASKKVSDARLLRDYGIRDQRVDPKALLDQLTSTGVPPELLDPNSPNALLITKQAPNLVALYAKPVADHMLADTLVRIAEYPFRYSMVMGIDDPDERVRTAHRLDRQWQAAHPGAAAPGAGDEASPPAQPPAQPPSPTAPPALAPVPSAQPMPPQAPPAAPPSLLDQPVMPTTMGG